MKQQLGLTYSNTEPLSAIISNRLVDLQSLYGGTTLLGGITRLKRDKGLKSSLFDLGTKQYWTDLHLQNLSNTYGISKVIEVYNMIFVLDNERKAI